MISKNQIKLIRSLQQKKFREEEKLFVAEGEKIVAELFASSFEIDSVFASSSWLKKDLNQKIVKSVHSGKIRLTEVSEDGLSKISSLSTPNEILALVKIPSRKSEISSLKNKWSLVLDEIKDPGNMGTIIRTADWFGIREIICSQNSVDLFNPKVIQATMGSFCRVNVQYANLSEFLTSVQKSMTLPVMGAMLDGENMNAVKLPSSGLILLGNESKGISDALVPFITQKIRIPSGTKQNSAESLNVAVAAGIICYHVSQFASFQKQNDN